jgi:Zn-dependent protease with chaperone function
MRLRSLPARLVALTLALALVAPQLALARYQPTTGRNAFTEEQEIDIGKQAAAEVYKKYPVLPDSDPLTRYVQRLGNRLAANAPGYKWPYNFHVVNQKEINAFALPGGPMFINVGTIQAADNEAQLAGVMAHELAHVVQRHATRAYTKQQVPSALAQIAGAILGSRGGTLGGLGQIALQVGVGSYFMKNTRDAEREADLVGTDVMYDTGYDPHQMAVFFQKLEAQGGSRGPEFFSDHPNPGNRAAAVSAEVNTLPARSFQRDSADFTNAKRAAAGLKPLTAQQIAEQQKKGGFSNGQAASGGATAGGTSPATMGPLARGDVMPSGSFRQFQHSAFTIKYPDNWQITGNNSSQEVTFAPRGGASDNSTAYGVLVGGQQVRNARSLDDATAQLIQDWRQGNPDLRTAGSPEDIRVNGVSAKSVDLLNTSPIKDSSGRTVRERDWLVTLPYGQQGILYVVFIAPETDFDALRTSAFEPMLRSLHIQQPQ